MKLFKKKPKPDVMGFICCETSLNRCAFMIDQFHDDSLLYPTYLYSTAMIFKNLEKKYSMEVIVKTQQYCDRFFLKKHKAYTKDQLMTDRGQVMDSLMKDSYVEDYLSFAGIADEKSVVENNLKNWMQTSLLLDDSIKSM